MRNVEYGVILTFGKFHFRIPHSHFRIQGHLSSVVCLLLIVECLQLFFKNIVLAV